jgi:hypothetical protein
MSKTDGRGHSVSPSRREAVKSADRPKGADDRVKSGHDGENMPNAGSDLLRFVQGRRFGTILVDPPWQFSNKTGKIAQEHKRLSRYDTMKLDEIMALPTGDLAAPTAHLWTTWGDQADDGYRPTWKTYANHPQVTAIAAE